jgi:cytochrome P450
LDTTSGAKPHEAPGDGGCPVLAGYDPLDPSELQDPYPGFRRARLEAPVFFEEKYGFWTVTRQEDVLSVLADDVRFSNRLAIPLPLPPEDLRDRMPVYPFARALLFMDDPEHRPVRMMLQEPFVPKRLRAREPRIRARAAELLTDRPDRQIEFLREYAVPLALTVIGDLVGVPEPDWPMLHEAVDASFQVARIAGGAPAEPGEMRVLSERLADYWEYLCNFARERQQRPTDDFSSVLAAQTNPDDGSQFTADQIAAQIETMLGAGFETSAQLLTFGVRSMLGNRDQWELLKSDRSLLAGAVEECVRHRTVTKRIFRITNTDVAIGAVTVPEGALVALSLASANHDDAVYEDPERFDIRRAQRNLTFGRGKHFCLGAPLAKIEMGITLEMLMDLAPDAQIAEDQELEWKPDYRLEALTSLRLNLGPAPSASPAPPATSA